MKRECSCVSRWLRPLLFCICAAGFLVGAWMAAGSLLETRSADSAYGSLRVQVREAVGTQETSPLPPQEDVQPAPPPSHAAPREEEDVPQDACIPYASMDFGPLQDAYPDMAAWLRAEGTAIDYPVMQAGDNDYYLDRLYTGERNRNGSLFMDWRNDRDFADRNTVIYGHNMRSGAMFRALQGYKDPGFYETVPVMYLATPGGDYRIELICGTVEDGGGEFVRFSFDSEADFRAYVEGFRARSTFTSPVELQEGDRIVSLCTCTYEMDNARYMLIGRLAPLYEAEP